MTELSLSPKRMVTVTFADGTMMRTSRNYTHAVVASALIPDRVRKVVASGIAADERHIARLERALESMDVVILSRGLNTPGKDLNLEGKKSWTLHKATLTGSGPTDDGRKPLSTWCNSEGLCSPTEKASDHLKIAAQRKLAALNESLASGLSQLAELDAGTFNPGTPELLRWAVGEEAAGRALKSEFAYLRGIRDVDVIAVDAPALSNR